MTIMQRRGRLSGKRQLAGDGKEAGRVRPGPEKNLRRDQTER